VISYADPAALIDDPRVLGIAIADGGEPMVDTTGITGLAVLARAPTQPLQ
jgi:hypothetical protein